MRLIAMTLAASAMMAGCAATPEQQARNDERDARTAQDLDQALAGYTAGTPQSCLPPGRTSGTRYFGNTILYEVGGNTIYRTDTGGGCRLGADDILITSRPTSSPCRGDIVRTLDRASRFETGSCAFGEFVPYRRGDR